MDSPIVSLLLLVLIASLIIALYHTTTFPFTALQTTTTTTSTTTTTTTIPPENNTIEWLEQRTFELVNEERVKYGLNELRWSNDIVDVCIDNRRTIVTRYWNPRGDRLFLFAQDADVAFDSVEIRPLSE